MFTTDVFNSLPIIPAIVGLLVSGSILRIIYRSNSRFVRTLRAQCEPRSIAFQNPLASDSGSWHWLIIALAITGLFCWHVVTTSEGINAVLRTLLIPFLVSFGYTLKLFLNDHATLVKAFGKSKSTSNIKELNIKAYLILGAVMFSSCVAFAVVFDGLAYIQGLI